MTRTGPAAVRYSEANIGDELANQLLPVAGPRRIATEMLGMRPDAPDEDVLRQVARLSSDQANQICKEIRQRYSCEQDHRMRYCLRANETYDVTRCFNICGRTTLANEYIPYSVDIPVPEDFIYVNDQYIKTELTMNPVTAQEIANWVANPPAGISSEVIANPNFNPALPVGPGNPATITVNFNPDNIRYRWTDLPGIRLFQTTEFRSQDHCIDKYELVNMLMYYKEFLPIESKELFNQLIGQDDGIETDAVFPDSEIIYRAKARLGAQTPKKEPAPLRMFVPLMFDHNTSMSSPLFLTLFKDRNLSFNGLLAKASEMAVVEYYSGTRDVITLKSPTVNIEHMELIGSYGAYDDITINSLNKMGDWKRLFRQYHTQKTCIQDCDIDEIEIKTRTLVECFMVSVRPLEYKDNFDLWHHLQPVDTLFTPMPIIVDNKELAGDNRNVVAVGPSISYRPKIVINKIGLFNNGMELETLTDPEVYTDLQKWKGSSSLPGNYIRLGTGVHFIKFNEYFPRKQISLAVNMASLDKSNVRIEFKPEIINEANELDQKYEVIIVAVGLNTYANAGNAIYKGYSN